MSSCKYVWKSRALRALSLAVTFFFLASMIPVASAESAAPGADQYEAEGNRARESLTGHVVNENYFVVKNDGGIPATVTQVVYKDGTMDYVDVPDVSLIPNETHQFDITRENYGRIGVFSARGWLYPVSEPTASGKGIVTIIEGMTEPGAPVTVVVHSKKRVFYTKAGPSGHFKVEIPRNWTEDQEKWFDNKDDHRGEVIDKRVSDRDYKIQWENVHKKWFENYRKALKKGEIVDTKRKRVDTDYRVEWTTKRSHSKKFERKPRAERFRREHDGSIDWIPEYERRYKVEWTTRRRETYYTWKRVCHWNWFCFWGGFCSRRRVCHRKRVKRYRWVTKHHSRTFSSHWRALHFKRRTRNARIHSFRERVDTDYRVEWTTERSHSKKFERKPRAERFRREHDGSIDWIPKYKLLYKAKWTTTHSKWFDDENDHSGRVIDNRVSDRDFKIRWTVTHENWLSDNTIRFEKKGDAKKKARETHGSISKVVDKQDIWIPKSQDYDYKVTWQVERSKDFGDNRSAAQAYARQVDGSIDRTVDHFDYKYKYVKMKRPYLPTEARGPEVIDRGYETFATYKGDHFERKKPATWTYYIVTEYDFKDSLVTYGYKVIWTELNSRTYEKRSNAEEKAGEVNGTVEKVEGGVIPGHWKSGYDYVVKVPSHQVRVVAGDLNRNGVADNSQNGGWEGFAENAAADWLALGDHKFFSLPLDYDPISLLGLSPKSGSVRTKQVPHQNREEAPVMAREVRTLEGISKRSAFPVKVGKRPYYGKRTVTYYTFREIKAATYETRDTKFGKKKVFTGVTTAKKPVKHTVTVNGSIWNPEEGPKLAWKLNLKIGKFGKRDLMLDSYERVSTNWRYEIDNLKSQFSVMSRNNFQGAVNIRVPQAYEYGWWPDERFLDEAHPHLRTSWKNDQSWTFDGNAEAEEKISTYLEATGENSIRQVDLKVSPEYTISTRKHFLEISAQPAFKEAKNTNVTDYTWIYKKNKSWVSGAPSRAVFDEKPSGHPHWTEDGPWWMDGNPTITYDFEAKVPRRAHGASPSIMYEMNASFHEEASYFELKSPVTFGNASWGGKTVARIPPESYSSRRYEYISGGFNPRPINLSVVWSPGSSRFKSYTYSSVIYVRRKSGFSRPPGYWPVIVRANGPSEYGRVVQDVICWYPKHREVKVPGRGELMVKAMRKYGEYKILHDIEIDVDGPTSFSADGQAYKTVETGKYNVHFEGKHGDWTLVERNPDNPISIGRGDQVVVTGYYTDKRVLTVLKEGPGHVTLTKPNGEMVEHAAGASYSFKEGKKVELEAKTSTDLERWEDGSGSRLYPNRNEPPEQITVPMDKDKTRKALFNAKKEPDFSIDAPSGIDAAARETISTLGLTVRDKITQEKEITVKATNFNGTVNLSETVTDFKLEFEPSTIEFNGTETKTVKVRVKAVKRTDLWYYGFDVGSGMGETWMTRKGQIVAEGQGIRRTSPITAKYRYNK